MSSTIKPQLLILVANWSILIFWITKIFRYSISVKSPWSAGVRVQPAIEMTNRPGSKLSECIPLHEPVEEETSFVNENVVDEKATETRIQSPIAWPEVDKSVEKQNIAKGMLFMNKAAFDPATEVIEEISSSPSIKNTENTSSGKVFRRNSATSITSKKSTSSLASVNALNPQAYIPYNVARRNISRVVKDMTDMQADHRNALKEVNHIYKEMENETQVS